MRRHAAAKDRRHGTAAVEFAVCLPLMCLVLTGLWEVGRITEVAEVMWNSAREAAPDASLGQDNLQTVTTNHLTYLRAQNQRPSVKVTDYSDSSRDLPVEHNIMSVSA